MKFIKGPSAWFKHQVCTFILDADQIKSPDDSRLALLKELALPLPAQLRGVAGGRQRRVELQPHRRAVCRVRLPCRG